MSYASAFRLVPRLPELPGVFSAACLSPLLFDAGVLNLLSEFFCDNLGAVWLSRCLSEATRFWAASICSYKAVVEMSLSEFVSFGTMASMTLRFFSSDDLGLSSELSRLPDPNAFDPLNSAVVVVDGSCGAGTVFFFAARPPFEPEFSKAANMGCPNITGARGVAFPRRNLWRGKSPRVPSFLKSSDSSSFASRPLVSPRAFIVSNRLSYRSMCLPISRTRNSIHKHCHSKSLRSLRHPASNPNFVPQSSLDAPVFAPSAPSPSPWPFVASVGSFARLAPSRASSLSPRRVVFSPSAPSRASSPLLRSLAHARFALRSSSDAVLTSADVARSSIVEPPTSRAKSTAQRSSSVSP